MDKILKQKMYNTYYNMKQRCYNPKSNRYKIYGGRGIKICDEWLNDKDKFFNWCISSGIKKELSIDRIDVDGDYCPENCRWATNKEQVNNMRCNVKLEYKGKEYTIAQLSELLNINYQTIHKRLKYYNYDIDKVLTAPLHIRLDYETKSGERYIYKIKDSYSVQIKKKYYGCRKSLEDAIKLRNEKLKELQIQGETKCK